LEQRRHYAALDGLRGFAAVSVVIFHIGHWLNMPSLAPNASVAVDLFFCLSGYVLSLAYGKRLRENLSGFEFMRLRLIRLMPLIVLATIISAAYLVVRAHIRHEDLTVAVLGTSLILGLVNLPYFDAPGLIGGPQLFPLNGPQYTLFLELFVNAIWSLSSRLTEFKVAIALAFACFLLLPFGFGGDTADTFWSGFPRVGASFFAGVAVFHLDRQLAPQRFGTYVFWVLVIAMVALFYFPRVVSTPFLLVWVGIISPLLVLAGARMKLLGPLRRLALLGGEISYAVYALHYSIFCWVNGVYQASGRPQNVSVEGPIILGTVLIGSYMALKFYDEPLRRWLSR
jgi:peptidoglycan/LPS O-acetylase OafA/YrhL